MAFRSGSVQVTLTSNATAYNLAALVAAVDTNISKRCAYLSIQSDPANAAALVWVGDASVSSSRYGVVLGNGDILPIGAGGPGNVLSTQEFWLKSDTNSAKINAMIFVV